MNEMSVEEAYLIRKRLYCDLGIYRMYARNRRVWHWCMKVISAGIIAFALLALIHQPSGRSPFIYGSAINGALMFIIIALGAIDHQLIGRSKSRIVPYLWRNHPLDSWESFIEKSGLI